MTPPDSFAGRLARRCLAAAVILLPFDQLPYFYRRLHGFSLAAANYPLALLIALWLWAALGGKAELPRGRGFSLLLAFAGWAALCTLVNARAIAHAAMPFPGGPSGLHRVLTQSAAFFFGAAVSLAVFNALNKRLISLSDIRFWAAASLVPVFLYSIPELAYLKSQSAWAAAVLNALAPKIRCTPEVCGSFALPATGFFRFHAVCGEPAQFGFYLAFALPWITGLALGLNRRRWFWAAVLAYVCALAFCTVSQTVYAVAAIEIGTMLVFSAAQNRASRSRALRVGGALAAALAAAFAIYWGRVYDIKGLSFQQWLLSLSNDGARNAGFKAAVLIAAHRPWFGAGWGQVGFYAAPYIVRWNITGGAPFSWWSTASLHAGILAETGIVGLGLWTALWLSAVAGVFQAPLRRKEEDFFGPALLAAGAAEFLVFFASANLWSPGAWIWLGLAWSYAARHER
ncbi:MAG: O-antigen ligase family protein [Elusimicrobiota bacterium]